MRIQSNPPLPLGAWWRHDPIRSHIVETKPKSVIEFGVGKGAMGSRIAAGRRYTGIEPDATSRREASLIMPPTAELLADESELNGRVYDLLCAFEVIEHIEEDSTVLEGWLDYVRPGGSVLLSVPAMANRMGPWDELAGHFRRYDPDQMKQLLSNLGLVDIRITLTGFPLGFALETARNLIAGRSKASEEAIEERTASSGRLLQPDRMGLVTRLASAPFRQMQRFGPAIGTGLVAAATRPKSSVS